MKPATEVRLNLLIYKDEFGYFSAYCPALNIAGQGKSEKTAIESFHQMVKIFFDETVRKGTLLEVLKELGWKQKNPSKPKPPASSPSNLPASLFLHMEVSVPVPALS